MQTRLNQALFITKSAKQCNVLTNYTDRAKRSNRGSRGRTSIYACHCDNFTHKTLIIIITSKSETKPLRMNERMT